MAGHVPRFGAPNGGSFTDEFTLAKPTGKSGSGDSRDSKEGTDNNQELKNQRSGGAVGRGVATVALSKTSTPDPPMKRVSGSSDKESVSNRGGYTPDSEKSAIPQRAAAKDSTSSREGKSSRGGRSNTKTVSDDHDASHIPTFGNWNDNTSGEEPNYTGIFLAASEAKRLGTNIESSGANSAHGGGDLHSPKKPSPSWCCCFKS